MIEDYIYHYYLNLCDDLVVNMKNKKLLNAIIYISILLFFITLSLSMFFSKKTSNFGVIIVVFILEVIILSCFETYFKKINSQEYIRNFFKKYPTSQDIVPSNPKERNFWIEQQKRSELKIVKTKIYNELKNNGNIDIKLKESYDFLKNRLSNEYLNKNSVLYDTYIDTSNTFKVAIKITLSILILLFAHTIKFQKLNLDLNLLPKLGISFFLSILIIYTLLSFFKDFLLSLDSISKNSVKQLISLIDEIYNEH